MPSNLLEYVSQSDSSIAASCVLIFFNLVLVALSCIKYALPIPSQFNYLVKIFFGCIITSSIRNDYIVRIFIQLRFCIRISLETVIILELLPCCLYIFIISMISYIFIDCYLSLKTLWEESFKAKVLFWSRIILNVFAITNPIFGLTFALINNNSLMIENDKFITIAVIEYSYWAVSVILMAVASIVMYRAVKDIFANSYGDQILRNIRCIICFYFLQSFATVTVANLCFELYYHTSSDAKR